uniref:Uncharacterized protein LOC114912650 isoform X1 n=1 Tax=Elaeis guineensis var. tenera TaxID=51953 RepID=A0A8N4IC07_ELAGV|nr:uncharacterized protein LOC114912650 isoform X1 [Elaeis guineensis]
MRRKASSLLPLLLLLRSLSNTSNGGGFFLLFFFTGVIRITMEDGIAPIAPPFGVIASRTFSSLSGPFVVLFVVGLEEAKCLRSFSGLAPLTPLLSIGFESDIFLQKCIYSGGEFYATGHGKHVPKLNRPPARWKALLHGLTTQPLWQDKNHKSMGTCDEEICR